MTASRVAASSAVTKQTARSVVTTTTKSKQRHEASIAELKAKSLRDSFEREIGDAKGLSRSASTSSAGALSTSRANLTSNGPIRSKPRTSDEVSGAKASSPLGNQSIASPPSKESPAVATPAPRRQELEWTPLLFHQTAAAYQGLGTKVKRSGDAACKEARHRMQSPGDASSKQGDEESAKMTAAREQAQLASLQLMDACLLFAYSFWCNDQSARLHTSAIASSEPGEVLAGAASHVRYTRGAWHTLPPLVTYAMRQVNDFSGHPGLLGCLRILQGCIERHMAMRDQVEMLHQMAREVQSQVAEAAEPTPAAGGAAEMLRSWHQRLEANVKQSNESSRHSTIGHSLLNAKVIQLSYPKTWRRCVLVVPDDADADSRSTSGASPSSGSNASADPMQMDPCLPLEHQSFSWPLPELSSDVFPSLVCFGRCLLAETADAAGLWDRFQLEAPELPGAKQE